jgi:tRNA-dihydrouridine synthase A
MAEPARVSECVSAMRSAVNVPVTIKCRIGVEPGMQGRNDVEFLREFIGTVAAAGCAVFVVHARRALLNGLSPKENREIPPLRYEVVAALRREFPQLTFVLNGGIRTLDEVMLQLQTFDGVMIGREAYQNPYLLSQLHHCIAAPDSSLPERAAVVESYARYVEQQLTRGERLGAMVRPMLGLYHARPGARAWRRFLSERVSHVDVPGSNTPNGSAHKSARLLLDSLRIVTDIAA